jgi:hypothetical protein
MAYLKTRELKRHQLGRHPDSWYITPHRLGWFLFSLILAPTPRMSPKTQPIEVRITLARFGTLFVEQIKIMIST